MYGDPKGRPVHLMHGLPGSRLQAGLFARAAAAAGVCLVAADRPGYGWSTPQPGRTVRDWADDVAAIADVLGHERFAVVGVSCGGPYALACGWAMPDRVSAIGLLGGMGPMHVAGLAETQLPILKGIFALAKLHPLLAAPVMCADRMLLRVSPGRAMRAVSTQLSGPDQQLLRERPHVAEAFACALIEGYRQGVWGAAQDAHLAATPHGMALSAITMPVHVFQGGQDRHVPPAMGAFLAHALPDATLHAFDGDGHLSIAVDRFGECLDAVLQ
jgi:pimeloyl-ACP methyl ester carboxylesterase